MGTIYEVWTGKDSVQEVSNYLDFKSLMLNLAKQGKNVRGYSLCINEKDNKYYTVRNGKLIAESNYLDN